MDDSAEIVEAAPDPRSPVVLAHMAQFRLGPLRVEPALRRVSDDRGEEEFVQPRVMQVLVSLARARGQVLTRDDLIESCWAGTIVGDDALNRIVSQIRKLAEGIGQSAFSVETVARVGYRLRCRSETSTGTEAGRRERRRRRPPRAAIWAAAVVLLFALLGAAWWLTRPTVGGPLALGLVRFESAGAGLDSGLPAGIDQELRAALGDRGVALTSGSADLILTGAVRRVGESLRVMARLDDVTSATTLWTRSQDIPAGDARALPEFVGTVSDILKCGLDGIRSHRRRLPNAQFSLFLRYCDLDATSGPSFRALDITRQLTTQAPDFAVGWLTLASVAGARDVYAPPAQRAALSREAMAAARRVIALEPDAEDGYTALALAMRPTNAPEREAQLRRAIGLRPLLCTCAYLYLGDFLLQSGRGEEALGMYRRGSDQEQGPLVQWRLAMGYRLADRQRSANEAMARLQTLYPDNPSLRAMQRQMAMWNGEWARAADLTRMDRPGDQAALREALAALASGDPARIGRARATVERLRVEGNNELNVVPILAALGDIDSVLSWLEASQARRGYYSAPGRLPGVSRPLLFDPLLRPVWHDSRFAAFLERAGFLRYWRESGSRPDMCRVPDAPAFCRQIGPPTA